MEPANKSSINRWLGHSGTHPAATLRARWRGPRGSKKTKTVCKNLPAFYVCGHASPLEINTAHLLACRIDSARPLMRFWGLPRLRYDPLRCSPGRCLLSRRTSPSPRPHLRHHSCHSC